MKKIGLFYGISTAKTAQVAKKIEDAFGKDQVTVVSVEEAWTDDFKAYDNLIVGAATWFDGELPTYWDEIIPELESLSLKGKKVAMDLEIRRSILIILLMELVFWLILLRKQEQKLLVSHLPKGMNLKSQEPSEMGNS